jgi:transposase
MGLTRFDGHPEYGAMPQKDVLMTMDAKERRPRRSFSKEFKAEVVQLVRTSGKTIAAIAREMDLGETGVREWMRQADIDAGRRDGLTTAEREELTALRKENRVLREERDILKRATVFFAKETR